MNFTYNVSTTLLGDGKFEQTLDIECVSEDGRRIGDRISQAVLDTREAQTRAALIALGWTPPPEPTNGRLPGY